MSFNDFFQFFSKRVNIDFDSTLKPQDLFKSNLELEKFGIGQQGAIGKPTLGLEQLGIKQQGVRENLNIGDSYPLKIYSQSNQITTTNQLTQHQEQPKFKPIDNWIQYRRLENMLLNSVREEALRMGLTWDTKTENYLRGLLFRKMFDYGLFRFNEQTTLDFIKMSGDPLWVALYLKDLEKAIGFSGFLLTPRIKQEVGLKDDIMATPDEIINQIQQLIQSQE